MVYTVEDLLKMEMDELQVLYVNHEITALQYIEALPEENELYASFLRTFKADRCEHTAKAYIDYDNQKTKEFPVII